MTTEAPLVAIVGRPNVGKSALFNRLTRSRRALVEPVPGTTRDRLYGRARWGGRVLRVVDTGGLEGDEDPFSAPIAAQVQQALEEADTILFVVDGSEGVTAADQTIADLLRRASVPVLLLANKGDRTAARERLHELYALGLGEPILISAYHGDGVADVLDMLVETLPATEEEPAVEQPIRIAIVGRPNVGKSSIVNAILGEQRVIVSEVPGTTRAAIDTPFQFERWPMVLVDTAGIRRRGRIERGVERHSAQQAERAIARADVVFLVTDQNEAATAQDTHIAGRAAELATGLVIVVNKWDTAEPGSDRHQFARRVDQRFRFVPWAPVHFTSALTGEGIAELLQLAVHISEVRDRRIQTSELNRVVHRAVAERPPPSTTGGRLKVLYATQADTRPPTFVFFVNDERLMHFSYRRYLENQLRQAFGFEGTALRFRFRSRVEEREEALA